MHLNSRAKRQLVSVNGGEEVLCIVVSFLLSSFFHFSFSHTQFRSSLMACSHLYIHTALEGEEGYDSRHIYNSYYSSTWSGPLDYNFYMKNPKK